jgi:2-polyprenyl-3-methyl-5-hydroxy-6-metoxy-1,4-benzoquinol methylase
MMSEYLYKEFWDSKAGRTLLEDKIGKLDPFIKAILDSVIQDRRTQILMKPDYLHFQPIKDKMKLGYVTGYEMENFDKRLYFSLEKCEWFDMPPTTVDILIKSDLDTLRRKGFYLRWGFVPLVLLLIDIITGKTKIIFGHRKLTKAIIWEQSWTKSFLKTLLGCDYLSLENSLTSNDLAQKVIRLEQSKKPRRKLAVLDAGCGEARIADLSQEMGCESVAIDINDWGIRRQAGRGRAQRVICDLLHMPFDNMLFDIIFLFEMIEHLDDNFGRQLIERLSNMIRIGGLLVLSTPNPDTPRQRIMRELFNLEAGVSMSWPYHKKEYTVDELRIVLEKRHLRVINVISATFPDIPFTFLINPLPERARSLIRRFVSNPSLAQDYFVICVKN